MQKYFLKDQNFTIYSFIIILLFFKFISFYFTEIFLLKQLPIHDLSSYYKTGFVHVRLNRFFRFLSLRIIYTML